VLKDSREKILQPLVHLVSFPFGVENKISEFFPNNCKPMLDKHILLLSTRLLIIQQVAIVLERMKG
jgi:hypothetical protein